MSSKEQVFNALTAVKWCPLEISRRVKMPVPEVTQELNAMSSQGEIKKHKDGRFSLINIPNRLKNVI